MTKEEAVKKIAELVAQAESNISQAEDLANEHSLDFEFCPAYGMGGTFYGEGHKYARAEQGWNPSSQSC